MNGRIYDPQLGRFLSADKFVDGVMALQGYNRYSYVKNNPLTLTDPTGYWSLLGMLEFTDGGGIKGFASDLGSYAQAIFAGGGEGAQNVAYFTAGAAAGLAQSNGAINHTIYAGDNGALAYGLVTGNALGAVQAAVEMSAGTTIAGGGGALTVTTGGAASPVSVPAIVGGTAMAVHGGAVGVKSAVHFSENVKQAKSAGGKSPNEGTIDGAKPKAGSDGGKVSEKTERVRHFTNNKGVDGIKADNKIKAGDQNSVFTEKAKGNPGGPRVVEERLGIKKGRGNNIVEFDAKPSEFKVIKNPQTGATERVFDGDVDLENRNPIFQKNR